MQVLRAVFVALAIAFVAVQYLQERKRLELVQRLPAAQARALYEAARRRADRALLVTTAVLALAGAGALFMMLRGGGGS